MSHRVLIFTPKSRYGAGGSLPSEIWLYSDGSAIAVHPEYTVPFSDANTLHPSLDTCMEAHRIKPSDLFRASYTISDGVRDLDAAVESWIINGLMEVYARHSLKSLLCGHECALRWLYRLPAFDEYRGQGPSGAELKALHRINFEHEAVKAALAVADHGPGGETEEDVLATVFLQIYLCARDCPHDESMFS